jgi:hypothetical protein
VGDQIAGIQPGSPPWLGDFDPMLRVAAFLVADERPANSSGDGEAFVGRAPRCDAE